MRKSACFEINRPLKIPSNDVSLPWPSFQSIIINKSHLSYRSEKNISPLIGKFNDTESSESRIPEKLNEYCVHTEEHVQNFKFILKKYEKFMIINMGISDMSKLTLLVLSFMIPYLNYNYPNKNYNPILSVLLIIFIIKFSVLTLGTFKQIYKFHQIKLQIWKILTISLAIFFLATNDKIYQGIFSLYLFYRNEKIIKRILMLLNFLNYRQIIYVETICKIVFQLHLFACLWGQHFYDNNEILSYNQCFYISFEQMILKFDSNEYSQTLILLNSLCSVYLIVSIFNNLITLTFQQQQYSQNLNKIRLYINSPMIDIQIKFILFHYQKLFLKSNIDNNQKLEEKKCQILEYLKFNLVKSQLKFLKFISDELIDQIGKEGQLIQDNQMNNTMIDGLFIIISGDIQVEFMNFQLNLSTKNLINFSLMEIINNQQTCKIILNKQKFNNLLYFYINQIDFQNCFKTSLERENYKMLQDQIQFYNNTKNLNIQCYFCQKYHPTFNCASFNVKRRFTYNQDFQERMAIYQRKKKQKSRAGIYQQLTQGGTSYNDILEENSESFQPFSDYSSEQNNSSGNVITFEQFCKQGSSFQKEFLQPDIISDKITEPIMSSTLIRNVLPSPSVILRQPNKQQTLGQQFIPFSELDSILEIDKLFEFQHYNVNFNLNNILKKISHKKN